MHEELLPLFPLPAVLLPGTEMPLHIFEERYKELIGEAIAEDSEFGIVLTRDQGVVNTGCTASVTQVVERYDDGRMDIVTTGRRRFELLELVDGRSFLQGKVRYFEDLELPDAGLDVKRRAVEAYTQARQATGQEPSHEPELADPHLSFQLAQIVNDADFRQFLLNTRSETERLRRLADYFPVHVVRWRHSEQLKVVAPRNGHSKHIPLRE